MFGINGILQLTAFNQNYLTILPQGEVTIKKQYFDLFLYKKMLVNEMISINHNKFVYKLVENS